ncbi:MAG: hypothetical protein K8S87_09150 [Planctomycetes bacterium]|nr:hypothetical protein [Planctomycetota bacterium]
MRTVSLSILVLVVFALVSCVPPAPPTKVQPDGNVIGKVITESDTQSTIKAWGQGPTPEIAKSQALEAAAKAMAKDTAMNINKVTNDSGWNQIVNRTCALNNETARPIRLQGGYRWEGQVVCQRQQLLTWLADQGYSVTAVTEKITLPKLCIIPSRLFGKTENLDLTEDEKYILSGASELLRDRASGFQIDDYVTLIQGWKGSITGDATGDIDINPEFAIEADMYITFDAKVAKAGARYMQASGTFRAVFVSTGKTAGDSRGTSEELEDNPANRDDALISCAKNGIDQIYEDMMKNWKQELEKGFYYRIIFTGVENEIKGSIYKALLTLRSPAGYNPSQNSFKNGKLDISVYVKNELGEPMLMFDAVNDALKGYGLKIEDTMLELRHALAYQIGKTN